MGYGTRTGGTPGRGDYYNIRTYWPDDSDTTIYIAGEQNLFTITERIAEKWPGEPYENFQISSENIQTDCLGYDCYDSSDWTQFIIIEKIK